MAARTQARGGQSGSGAPGGTPAGPPAPVNLIVGGEPFLAERRRQEIVAAARTAAGQDDLPVDRRTVSELSGPELAELLSPSLFAEDRIIVVSGLEDAGKDTVALIEQAVADPPDGVVLILEHTGKGRTKSLVTSLPKKGAQVHQAAELKGRERQGFVDGEFRRHGVRVTADVTLAVLNAVGTDLRELASAVSQLVADTDGAVTQAAVARYYSGKAEVSGFDVAELAVRGQVNAAVGAARRALQLGVPNVLLASALSGMVGDIAKVQGAGRINAQRQAADYGMPPWKLDKTVGIARGWTPAAVARAVQVVAELDAGVKGHSADAEYAVEHAVREIAQLAGPR